MENKTNNGNATVLTEEAIATFDSLEQLLSPIDENVWDKNPAENSWSVGQTMEHILKATAGFKDFITENVKETDRSIDEKVAILKSVFLDFTTKMQAPEFIIPTETSHDKQQQLNELKALKNEIIPSISTLDLSKTCLNFEMPVFGYLTRFEWINFSLFHTQRHTHQIRNILSTISK